MKIIIAYPPLGSGKGVPLLSQNRQFQYFKEPTFIYPVVPASAATMLRADDHEVLWLDGIAEGLTRGSFLERVRAFGPDLIALETKTPVVAHHWRWIDDLKEAGSPWTVLFGDHVTAMPQESFARSRVDFVLTGGDYDFLLRGLCANLHAKRAGGPAKDLEPGIWYREGGTVLSTGPFRLDHDLDTAPLIDRDLTRWTLYAHKNGNFRRTPGAYTMAGRDCWWGRCTFCSWPTLYPKFRARSPVRVADEIEQLVTRHGVREIMDDTGTFPTGAWLKEFCAEMVRRGLPQKVSLDCNMRFGAVGAEEYRMMKAAGFRLVLFGLESGNQATLDRLDKNLRIEDIARSCRAARRAGLYPHITIMFGYPWESHADALKTLDLGRRLLVKGDAYTVQATLVIPYPGSRLFVECRKNGWLRTENWEDYDMKRPVMTTPIPDAILLGMVQGIYRTAFNPEFVIRRLGSVRDLADLAYFGRGVRKVAGHLFDFARNRS
ncbi:MAG: B12-binding domain-containing radical SAM protein [Deltaproteobacteria bacterium]